MKIRKGDTVIVIAGNDKGKTGEVIATIPKKNRVIVQGVNIVTKHQKPNPRNNTGGRIQKEAPLHVSNVMYYDKQEKKGVRLGYQILDNGEKVRISRASGKAID